MFRVVLALSAAGVGVVLPGLFEFQAQWARMGVRAGGAIGLFALVFFVTPTTPQRPDDMPPLSLANWDIRSEDKSAEGLAVDTDPLTISWRAGGDAHDLEIWLENVQTTKASRVLRTSASQHKVTFAREDYVDVLSSRTPGTVNRVRVVANALPSGQRAISQEFDLHVGLTVLLTADRPDVLHVSALIDDSTAALPMYAFKGTLVNMIVDDRAEGRGSVSEMVADSAWFRNPMAEVPLPGVKTDPKFWNNLYFIYEGPGDSRLVRTKKMFTLDLTGEVLHD